MCSCRRAYYFGTVTIDTISCKEHCVDVSSQGCTENCSHIARVGQTIKNEQRGTLSPWSTRIYMSRLKDIQGQNTYHTLRCLHISQCLNHALAHFNQAIRRYKGSM